MLVKKLEEHLKLLKNSAILFDKGHSEEALNIAIRLRVLIYRDDSLLGQLGQKDTIKLLSTMEDFSKNPFFKNMHISFSTHFLTSNGQRAFLGNTQKKINLPLIEWLKESITSIDGKYYSRLDIIKTTAHKDGGAHIEIDHKDLSPFIKKTGEFSIIENNEKVKRDIINHHHVLLRQIAYEILHSKELFELNGLIFKPMEEIKSYNEYLKEADTLRREEKYFQAIRVYEKAIEVNPNNASYAYNDMGLCLSHIKESDEAIESFKKAIEQSGENIIPVSNLAKEYIDVKKYSLAINFLLKIIQEDNKINEAVKYNEAVKGLNFILEIIENSNEELIKQYNNYQNVPKNEIYVGNLAFLLLKNNYFKEAEEVLKYSLLINPVSKSSLNNLGYVLYKNEKYYESNDIFNKLIDLVPNEIYMISNILEFKLIKGYDNYEKTLASLKNIDKLLYSVFKILFDVRSNINLNKEINEFISNFKGKKEFYDYSDLEEWVISNNLNDNIIELLETCFIKKS